MEAEYWKKEQKIDDGYKRVFVGGLSQGCAISLAYGLTSKNIIGGVIGLSGHLFNGFELPNLGKLPLLLYHGHKDQTISFEQAYKSYKKILGKDKV